MNKTYNLNFIIDYKKQEMNEELIKKYHYRLIDWIKKTGSSSYKKHGKYWAIIVNNVRYHLDDYNGCIHFNDFYVGGHWGEFSTKIDINTYRYHIGILYKYWLKNKKFFETSYKI